MRFDRRDILQAYYWFGRDYARGLSDHDEERVEALYDVPKGERGPTTDNAKAIYAALVRDYDPTYCCSGMVTSGGDRACCNCGMPRAAND